MSTVDDLEGAFDLLRRASGEVRALADRMETISGQFDTRLSNPWREEIPALVSKSSLDEEQSACLVGVNGDDPLGRAQTIAAIWSARDHLYAISNCLVDQTVFSLISLSRIVMEAACTAAWLNADGEYPRESLWRSVTLARGHLLEQVNLSKIALNGTTALSDKERQSIIAEQKRSQNDRSCLEASVGCLGLLPIQRVNKSQIVQDMMRHLVEYLDPGVSPAIFYKTYSGAVHGDPNTMIAMLDRGVPASEHGFRTISLRSRLDPVLWTAAATTMMLKTVDHWWDTSIKTEGIDDHANGLCRIVQQSQQ